MSISSLFSKNDYELYVGDLTSHSLITDIAVVTTLEAESIILDPTPAAADDAEALLAVNPLGAGHPLVTMNVGEGVAEAVFTFLTYPGVPPGSLPAPITNCPINYIRLGGSCICNAAIFPFPATTGSFTGTLTLPPGLARSTPFSGTAGELIGTVTSSDNENTVSLEVSGYSGSTSLAEFTGNVAFAGNSVITASFSYNGIP